MIFTVAGLILCAILSLVNINKWQDGGSHWFLAGSLSGLVGCIGFTYDIMMRTQI